MIVPIEMQTVRPMHLSDGEVSTTTRVWDVLMASRNGDVDRFRELTANEPGLAYAQYNYTPPIYFAVREGHVDLVSDLLSLGALDPSYRTYPFLDTLVTFAVERGFEEIAELLRLYVADPKRHRYAGDNGEIDYDRTPAELAFQRAVGAGDIAAVERFLAEDSSLPLDPTYHWGEGILLFPAKSGNWELLELLLSHGAAVPKVSKWARFYYFERTDSAAFLLEHGMDPNHMSWHRVTLLHDMAQSGDLEKAKLLIDHGADIEAIDDEYLSTPLGFAARWGNLEMVRFLLENGANPERSGAAWSTPVAWAACRGHDAIVDVLNRRLA